VVPPLLPIYKQENDDGGIPKIPVNHIAKSVDNWIDYGTRIEDSSSGSNSDADSDSNGSIGSSKEETAEFFCGEQHKQRKDTDNVIDDEGNVHMGNNDMVDANGGNNNMVDDATENIVDDGGKNIIDNSSDSRGNDKLKFDHGKFECTLVVTGIQAGRCVFAGAIGMFPADIFRQIYVQTSQ
jgi:hypothetical protein